MNIIPQLRCFSLPRWQTLPELDLYMDQLISLLEKYLAPMIEADQDKVISRAIINNYVKLKIIPATVKKRYDRRHIAYLIILCMLKSVLPLPVISQMLETNLKETPLDVLYDRFCEIAEMRMAEIALMAQNAQEHLPDLAFDAALRSVTGAYLAQLITEDEEGTQE